jgi:uncharacterized protein (DUF58 family)
MYFPVKSHTNKLQFSVYAAAAMIHLLNKQRDATGLSLFNDDLYFHTKARLSQPHIHKLYAMLDELLKASYNEKQQSGTQLSGVLHQIAEATGKRSLVIIFSDMFENNNREELYKALEHLRYNKHEVVLFHVYDSRFEQSLQLENRPYKLIDMENGDTLKLRPQEVEAQYAHNINAFYEDVRAKCLQYKTDFVPADINSTFDQVLTSFLLHRKKMF